MILVLTGDNTFEIKQALDNLIAGFDGQPEKIDGESLELRDIPDLLMGTTLFAEKRLVIIKDLSKNKSIWEKLPDWLDRISDDIELVLIEEKLDKRTNSYRALKSVAEIQEHAAWTERDNIKAEAWAVQYAQSMDMQLDKKLARHLVERVGADQWQLSQAIDKLSFVESLTQQVIDEIIEPNIQHNVFQLFELMIAGNSEKINQVIKDLKITQDPYQIFALISSQAFQLLAVASSGQGDDPAKDFAIHPFVASKLKSYVRKVGVSGAKQMVQTLAKTDADIKTSRAEPWVLLQQALIVIAQKNNPR